MLGHLSAHCRQTYIDGHSLIVGAGPTYRNWALAGAIRDTNGLFVGAGNHWVPDHPYFTHSATGLTDTSPSGNGKITPDRYFGIEQIYHSDAGYYGRFTYPIEFTRQDSGGTAVSGGTWTIGDGTVAPFLDIMRHAAVHNGGRYVFKVTGHVSTSHVMFNVTGMENSTDIFMIGVEYSGAVPAKVIQRAQQWSGSDGANPADPTAGDISTGNGRILTSTGSLANVVSDTTGTIFYQDTGANLVWFKVKVASLITAGGVAGPYYQVAIAVKAA